MKKYLFCFNIVGLSPAFMDYLTTLPNFSHLLSNGRKTAMEPVFPCLTLPAQASLSTGKYPGDHGIVANGIYYREKFEVSFWDQYRYLVEASPIWESLKNDNPNLKTAVLFWQNTLYSKADFIITPKPMHTHDGMIQWCYSKPVGLYENVCNEINAPFNLMDYWGLFASSKSSSWIMKSCLCVLRNHLPDLMMVYLPHLDYSCQKFGPDLQRNEIKNDLKALDDLMGDFLNELERLGITHQSTIAVFSEYSISKVSEAIKLNRVLREHGFLKIRSIEGREYLDFELSRAFAMVDHQVAHIYIKAKDDIAPIYEILSMTDGVEKVLDHEMKKKLHIDHYRSGELIAVACPDKWFAYYWWDNPVKAPDFACNVDIHRKPGYDPLELFMDPGTKKISLNTQLIKGSHGALPENGERMAVFMISGNGSDKISLDDNMKMIDAASMLRSVLLD